MFSGSMKMPAQRPRDKVFERKLCASDEAIVSSFCKNITCIEKTPMPKTPKDYGLVY
jgi:hypothetical protein